MVAFVDEPPDMNAPTIATEASTRTAARPVPSRRYFGDIPLLSELVV
jgi:hypothetical protein